MLELRKLSDRQITLTEPHNTSAEAICQTAAGSERDQLACAIAVLHQSTHEAPSAGSDSQLRHEAAANRTDLNLA